MSNLPLFPYTDETPEERESMQFPVTSNISGFFINVTGDSNTRNALTVFIPHSADWACTIEGSPDDTARAFVVRDIQELERLIPALQKALSIVRRDGRYITP